MAARTTLRSASLCAGIGGLDLGLRPLGVEPVVLVERDAFAAACLVARMGAQAMAHAAVWDDLGTFDPRPWRGVVDLVSAGYPCQPFSVAGKRLGAEDPRHLWPHVARIVDGARPALVVLENVARHASHGLDAVCGDLADLGYDAEWGVLTAASVGAPHRRARLFVVAWEVSDAGRVALRELAERGERLAAERRDAEPGGVGIAGDGRGSAGARGDEPDGRGEEAAGVGNAEREGREGSLQHDGRDGPSAQRAGIEVSVGDAGRTGREEADPRGQPFPPGPSDRDAWRDVLARRPGLAPAQPSIRGVAHGAARGLEQSVWADRLRCLGNAVVPAQATAAVAALARRALT